MSLSPSDAVNKRHKRHSEATFPSNIYLAPGSQDIPAVSEFARALTKISESEDRTNRYTK